MSTKAATAATESTAEQGASGNITLAQLGQRMNKGRKPASTPKPATTGEATADTATSSEQADAGEAGNDLSQSAETDSSALAAEAQDAENNTETGDEAGAGDDAAEAGDETNTEPKPEKPVRDLQKRVGKLTEQRNELRSEVQELRDEIKQLRQAQQQTQPAAEVEHPGDSGFVSDRAVVTFNKALEGVEAFLTWADDDNNKHGGTFTEGGKSYELSAEEVKAYRRTCEREARDLAAKREARLETLRGDFDARRNQAHAEALRLYPWIEQKGSPEFQEALALIRQNPEVLKKADFELVIARQVVGARLEREATKRAAKPVTNGRPKGSATPAPVVTHTGSAAPRVSSRQAATSAAESTFQQTGRTSDLSKLLAQRRRSQSATD